MGSSMADQGRPSRRLQADRESIIESVTDAFFAVDKDWRFTYINRNGERILGKEPDELLGQVLWDVYPDLPGTRFDEAYRAVASTGVATSFTAYYPDHRRWYEVHAYPAAQGISVYFRNVTDRMEAEAILRKSEQKYRMLFASIDEGFCVIEVKFNQDGTAHDYVFLETNPAFEKQTGISNAVGRSICEIAPTQEVEWFEQYGRVAKTGEPVRFENQAVSLGRWFDVYAFRVDGSGANRVAVLFSDITDRKRIVAQLHRADRQKDDFLAMLAHELRNPLAPIATAAQILRRASTDAEQVTKMSAIITRQVEHITRLVDDLLDVSRVTRDLVKLECAPLDINVALYDALEQVRPLLDARRHRVHVRPATQPVWVNADKVRLVQLVCNLLSNAAKYTPFEGDIHIETCIADEKVELEVRDNGMGIATDLNARIFDLFVQGARSADRPEGGLGLGLALVKKIIEMHGGSVVVHSEGAGKGSAFRIALDRIAVPERSLPAMEGSAIAGDFPPIKVMVVDDNADAAATLASLLQTSGFDTVVANDAASALQHSSDQEFDAFILDIGLPKIDGYALARLLQESPRFSSAVFIAVTGYGPNLQRERELDVRIDFHFMKPVNDANLVSTIRQAALASLSRQS
jgi:PAS domain S-box-containing protein